MPMVYTIVGLRPDQRKSITRVQRDIHSPLSEIVRAALDEWLKRHYGIRGKPVDKKSRPEMTEVEVHAEGLPLDYCIDCSGHHTPGRRASLVRRLLPATTAEIMDALAHFYPAGTRALYRDLLRIGARRRRVRMPNNVVEADWTLEK